MSFMLCNKYISLSLVYGNINLYSIQKIMGHLCQQTTCRVGKEGFNSINLSRVLDDKFHHTT